MQEYNRIEDTEYISDAPSQLNKNMESIATDFSGASFPTENLFVGMKCLRTDENKIYRLYENASNQLVWQHEYTIVDGGIKVKQADGATNDANGKAITGYVTKVEVGSQQGKIKVTDGAGNETEFASYTIATQSEAKVGTDNTKSMTPLQTKNAIDYNNATNRLPNTNYAVGNVVYNRSNLSVALKCTTDGTTSNTELDISGRAVGDSVDDGSVVWKIVSRDVVNIIDAQRPIKTFISLKQLGLDNNASEADIANTLPVDSVLQMVLPAANGSYPNLSVPKQDGVLVVFKSRHPNNVDFRFKYFVGDRRAEEYVAFYTSWASPTFSGWKRVATNGALSMPSYSKGYIEISLSITANSASPVNISNAYTAPCDGWLKFMAVGGTESGIKEAKAWTNSDISMTYFLPSGSTTNGVGMEFFVPIAKGDVVNLSYRNIKSFTCRFIYAQSEV